jgi:hypothetical protein
MGFYHEVIAGEKKYEKYRGISLNELAGQTIEGVIDTYEDGKCCIILLFADGTEHRFYIA